jgi:hypothetical protein
MRALRRHVFQPGTDVPPDHNGQRYGSCCPLGEHHEIHDLPEQDAAVTQAELRRLGERGGE